MPKNTGKPPKAERVDLLFVNGHVERNQEPGKWRWTRDDPKFGTPDWDILEWQIAKG